MNAKTDQERPKDADGLSAKDLAEQEAYARAMMRGYRIDFKGVPINLELPPPVVHYGNAEELRARRLARRFWLMVAAFVLSAISCVAFLGAWAWFRGPAFLALGFAWGVLVARLVEEA